MNKIVASVGVVAMFASVASATNYFVVPPGTEGVPENPDYLSWETAGTNIHEAVYIANGQYLGKMNGILHRLYVKTGTYLITNEISIIDSRFEMRSSKGPAAQEELDPTNTVLCGGYPLTTNRIVKIHANSVSRDVVFRGFTVTNGWVQGSGAGIYVSGAAHNRTGVYDCRVLGNFAYLGMGGGICCYTANGYGIVSNCFVSGNVASNVYVKGSGQGSYGGAGVCLGLNGAASYVAGDRTTRLRIFDTVVSNNFSYGNGVMSPGIWVRNNGAWVERCTVVDNHQHAMSGGNLATGYALYSDRRCRFIDCAVIGNSVANSDGCGMRLEKGAVATNCVLRGNSGSSVVSMGPDVNTIQGVTYTNAAELVGCTIADGKGVAAVAPSTHSIVRNCLITGFSGYSGQIAPLQLSGAECTVENCTVVGNSKGTFASGSGHPVCVNCLFYNDQDLHQATLVGDIGVTFSNCYFKAKSAIGSQPNAGCVFAADPKFTDAANGDYSIVRKSPCRDTGFPCAWQTNFVDLAGNPRVFGKAVDIGAYENQERDPGLMLLLR